MSEVADQMMDEAMANYDRDWKWCAIHQEYYTNEWGYTCLGCEDGEPPHPDYLEETDHAGPRREEG